MTIPPGKSRWSSVDEVVEAFESVVARGDRVEIADFAPPPDHPERLAILCELVRVDLEHRWERGQPRPLEDYRARFPVLFQDSKHLHAMVYEEYRLRLQAGETPTATEYRQRFGIAVDDWPAPPSPSGPPRKSSGPVPVPMPVPASESELCADEEAEMALAASAYRAYRSHGSGGPEELNALLGSYGIPAAHGALLRSLDRTDPHAAERLVEALAGLPCAGASFLGFRLCGELGRGAFGRVFLARQGDLSDRLVALKVSADVAGESHALARLQHTNIVPIYSVHRRGPLQAVCMPYLGATTLADTLASLKSLAAPPRSGEDLVSSGRSRKVAATTAARGTSGMPAPVVEGEGDGSEADACAEPSAAIGSVSDAATSPQVERLRTLRYVPAVLWLGARVADGLAHAHERGILHRDLKPANILFADDGEPILLDFNLAVDTRAGAAVALVGGTLPYMAPEHLRAFLKHEAAVDARSDIYALGVILYELLTGTHPFPIRNGAVDAIMPEMLADRLGPVPDVRRANPAVSPAVASIVRHCLEPDPQRRYTTARQLHEDLERQLGDQPLQYAREPSLRERLGKWARRHPRLTSSTMVGLIATTLFLGGGSALVVRHWQYQRAAAAASYRSFGDERRQAAALLTVPFVDPTPAEEGLGLCQDAAERYGVLGDRYWLDRPLAAFLPQADRIRLREDFGDLLILWAQALTRRAATRDGHARSDDLEAAALRLEQAEGCYGAGAGPRALLLARADLAALDGRGDAEVRRLRAAAAAVPLRTDRERLLVNPERVDPELRARLLADMETLSQSRPQDFATWIALGNWNVRLGRSEDALTAYNVAVALAPRMYWTRYNRGLYLLEIEDFSRARDDFDQVVDQRPDLPSPWLNRALARLGMGDAQGAIDDLTRCLALKGAPARTWFVRAQARQRLGDREGARRDREQGLKQPPRDPASFVARGLARLPGDAQGALADFDAALALAPRYRHALQDKASVLSENLNQPEPALNVLDTALTLYPDFVPALAGRGVLRARLGRRDAALHDARAALGLDHGATTVYQAACVYALTSKQEPADRPEALRLLAEAVRKEGAWLAVARRDPDLEPIRGHPGFRDLLQALEVVLGAGKTR
jgi:serine/threonine protein kinase/regulator of sirC expression with transglutaminase-like and TPR domain